MKAIALPLVVVALASCATTASGPATPDTSNYTAKLQADGTIELVVTGITAEPTATGEAKLELGPMLEAAAAKECPPGYDLIQDPVPTVRTEAGRLIATLRGVARCK
jgi:hypothetical protein